MPDNHETDMTFVEACSLQEVPPGAVRPLRLGTADVVLFNVDGSIHALENSCLHAGAALSGGRLCGKVVACPAHGWRYDVTTGALLVAPEKTLKRFPVRIAGGKILVQLAA
ncbi:MAG TPA: Rieske (2Fe-2S) protein [Azonexus sp.]